MNDTLITLTGWLGADATIREANGTPVASFRMATTPRRFNRKTGEWSDAPTQWYAVTAWRQLAENCAGSLRRGDPVVVHGRLTADIWTSKSGMEVTTMAIEASFVGHDLNRGVSQFVRNPRSVSAAGEGSDDAATSEVSAA